MVYIEILIFLIINELVIYLLKEIRKREMGYYVLFNIVSWENFRMKLNW